MQSFVMVNLNENDEKFVIPIRSYISELFDHLNKIALDVMDEENIPDSLFSGLPFQWDLHQIYNLIQYFHKIKPLQNYCFIAINDELLPIDVFLISVDEIEKKEEEKLNTLRFNLTEIDDIEKKGVFLEKISKKIEKRISIKEDVNSLIDFDKNLPVIIIPHNFIEIISEAQIPLLNLDIFKIFEAKDRLEEVFYSKFDKEFINYVFSLINSQGLLFSFIKDMVQKAKNEELPKWSSIISTLLDGVMTNIVILLKKPQKVILVFRIIIEDNRFRINPLPWRIVKKCNDKQFSPEQIAEFLYNSTGFRTELIFDNQILKLLRDWNKSENNVFDLFTNIFSLSYTSIWSPDSLLNEFLKLFGFELGKGVQNFSRAIKVVIQYFENILIVVYKNGTEGNSYNTLVKFSVEQDKFMINIIDTKPFKKQFSAHKDDSLSRLKGIKSAVEESLGIKFNGCFGFDIKILSESLSAKNIQALLSVNTMAHQLPFVATVGALFTGMKALGVEKVINGDEPFLEIYKNGIKKESTLTSNKMKFVNYFDAFLKKGILFISSEGRD
ncbi:MAG: hypothetical protein ACTSXK_12220, partial [Promethearchaeota archaeon]